MTETGNLIASVAFAASGAIAGYLAHRIGQLEERVAHLCRVVDVLTERIGWIQRHAEGDAE